MAIESCGCVYVHISVDMGWVGCGCGSEVGQCVCVCVCVSASDVLVELALVGPPHIICCQNVFTIDELIVCMPTNYVSCFLKALIV